MTKVTCFSAIELTAWRSVMREQASSAERRPSVVGLYSVRSPRRSSCYVLSHFGLWQNVTLPIYCML